MQLRSGLKPALVILLRQNSASRSRTFDSRRQITALWLVLVERARNKVVPICSSTAFSAEGATVTNARRAIWHAIVTYSHSVTTVELAEGRSGKTNPRADGDGRRSPVSSAAFYVMFFFLVRSVIS